MSFYAHVIEKCLLYVPRELMLPLWDGVTYHVHFHPPPRGVILIIQHWLSTNMKTM